MTTSTPELTSDVNPPSNPAVNDLWYNTTTGFLFIWYDDGNTLQWVVANPGRGQEGPPGPAGPPGPPFSMPKRVSANYAAQAFEVLVVDVTLNTVTIDLSPLPHDLDAIEFDPANDSWGNPNFLIINAHGVPINGVSDTLTCDVPAPFQLRFMEEYGWIIVPLRGPIGPQGIQGPPGQSMVTPTRVPIFVANAYQMVVTDLDKTFEITTGSGADQSITLYTPPVDASMDGHTVAFQKADAGTAILIIKDPGGATDNTHLLQQGDYIRLRINMTTWTATDTRIRDVFRVIDGTVTGSYVWPKRPRLTNARFFGIGGGAGGGGGRRGAAGSARSGGGGGAVGNVIDRVWDASFLPTSITFTIGAAAPGGLAATADDTNGGAGTAGNDIIATNWFRARGGSAGTGGSTTAAGASISQTSTDRQPVANGGASSITANSAAPGNSGGGGPGGGGGCISTANTHFSGAAGGSGSLSSVTSPSPGSAGTAGGTNGGNGAGVPFPPTRPDQEAGSGGGGGGGNAAGIGGNGGDGGYPGGGGGGGGASVNGFDSGHGGAGAAARLMITESYSR